MIDRNYTSMPKALENNRNGVFILLLCVMAFISTSAYAAEVIDINVYWDVDDEPLNIGDVLHFAVETDMPGSVVVDISTVHESIQLYDDGTNGDAISGDNIHELDYTIFEGDTVSEGPIIVRFIAEDNTEVLTDPEDDMTPTVTIDGTRPVLTNDSVAPDPFNPNYQVAYIRYILTEASTVSIDIYSPDNQLVRKLGTPSGKPGENQTSWDGNDNQGNMLPDGIYTYEINATDTAGNEAISTRGGCILSTVRMEIDNSLIAPNPFSPDGDDVEDVAWITFDVMLYASEEQLSVLGFGNENYITTSTEDDDDIYPFALMGISIFNSSGSTQFVFDHDMTPNADTDFAPNGWPRGKMPSDVPPGSGNYFGLPNDLLDVPDDNKKNDWDTLIPLSGPFESEDGPYYESRFSVGWEAEFIPDGTYLVNLECELVGRTYEFAGYLTGPSGIIIGEKWHAVPARHHGITAYSRRKAVTVDRDELIAIDDDPPIIASTTPSAGSIIDPGRDQIKEVSVTLDDGAGGSGVDPIQSTVSLLDPLGNKLAGQLLPFSINVVKLILDNELSISGTYTISVVPVDKRGNKAVEPSLYIFTVADTSAPVVVPNTVQPVPTEFDTEGRPIDPYTQPIQEVSAVLTDGLTGTGVDLENSTIYVRNSNNETIDGELILDDENTKLINKLDEPLLISDTYTIVIIATDKAGTKAIYTYQFALDMAENIVIRYGGKTYLTIYASTTAVGENPVELNSLTVNETEDFPGIVSELSLVSDTALELSVYDVQLSQNADMNMYYDELALPLGTAETELSIYAYKTQAKEWIQIPNINILEEENKITARIDYLDQYYVVAYTSPVAPSVSTEDVIITPPKYFNPEMELLTFSFNRDVDEYKIEIYNIAGDRVALLKEQGRGDNSLAWDGKAESSSEYVHNGIFICRITYKKDKTNKNMNKLVAVIR
ncbi:hypothetical protein GF312_15460 [Candidatus Poribacteria bacterium]|nr:hypothetical protein [Candidatus Poribacteria bacterium]